MDTELENNLKRFGLPTQFSGKKKRAKKKKDPNRKQSTSSPDITKYYNQRYRLFSKYDKGIRIDNEGWFSVTPEKIAEHIASRCADGVILDPFCGVGGNTIQFALSSHLVIAVDKNPVRLEFCRHNARIYGVEDRIEFILGDFLTVYKRLKCDVVFISPPWGGPEYLNQDSFSLKKMPIDGFELFEKCFTLTKNICYFLPRNTDHEELKQLAKFTPAEVEENYLGSKVKAISVYFGDLVNFDGQDESVKDKVTDEIRELPETLYNLIERPANEHRIAPLPTLSYE